MNINDKVTVTLTSRGENILYKHYYLYSDMKASERMTSSHRISGHTYSFQLWELMEIFGGCVGMGSQQMFVNNKIEIHPKV